LSYFDFLPQEDERWEFIGDAIQYIIDHQKWKPFAKAEDKELAEEDRTFICKIMKLDPRDTRIDRRQGNSCRIRGLKMYNIGIDGCLNGTPGTLGSNCNLFKSKLLEESQAHNP
jgi:hypothetical protein